MFVQMFIEHWSKHCPMLCLNGLFAKASGVHTLLNCQHSNIDDNPAES